jgi:Fe-Mn family superoxide dismutase
MKTYKPRAFPNLKNLNGLSAGLLADHLKLYEGYVKNTNLLTEKLSRSKDPSGPEYAEMTRRLGFEYNGMALHEYYFENLTAGGPKPGRGMTSTLEGSFGSYDAWLADFKAIAAMRGVGWAILFQDPRTGWLSNHWVTLHNDGNIAGFRPILVCDAWEHAFVPDYKPHERDKYVTAFMKNIHWEVCEGRLVK